MSPNPLNKKFFSSSLAKEEMNFEMILFHFSGTITICVNMLLKIVQRMLYNFGLPSTSMIVLQTIKLFEYMGHIVT